jgi:hypothetical protein
MYSDKEMIVAFLNGVCLSTGLVGVGIVLLLYTGHLHIYKELYCIW